MPDADRTRALDRLRSTSRDLVSLTSTATSSALRRVPRAGEWSPALVLVHMADHELVYSVRLRMMVAEHRPQLLAYDEAAWAERYGDLDPDPKDTLARFRILRETTLGLLESLTEDEWARVGVHQQRGEQSVQQVVVLMAEHDRNHLAQLRQSLSL